MITGIFHQGSGMGNQLHRYVATRVKAKELDTDFGMIYNPDDSGKEEWFKGKGFMDIDMGSQPEYHKKWQEKGIYMNGEDIRPYDPEFNFVEDGTLIDGEFQDERYWENHEEDVREWLKVMHFEMPDNLCIIGFRGGEFSLYPDLFLTKEYWDQAVKTMREINPDMMFEVHTDDFNLASRCFPDFKVIHDIGLNWRSVRYAKYAIIANSSFFILPRWLRQGETEALTIAPRYWGRRNTGVWSLSQNYYKRFKHI